jgi:hypothetical protein
MVFLEGERREKTGQIGQQSSTEWSEERSSGTPASGRSRELPRRRRSPRPRKFALPVMSSKPSCSPWRRNRRGIERIQRQATQRRAISPVQQRDDEMEVPRESLKEDDRGNDVRTLLDDRRLPIPERRDPQNACLTSSASSHKTILASFSSQFYA